MKPKSRSDIYMEQTDMSSYSSITKMLFNLLKAKEEEIEKENIEKIKKAVSEFTKQLAEEKRVSEIPLPDLEDLSKSRSRSSGGKRKNNKTKKHKK